jgi:aromatic ring hydroxylase
MIRTGQQYKESICDGRQVWINGERVNDVTHNGMDERARVLVPAVDGQWKLIQ